jgi:hypothetical protein
LLLRRRRATLQAMIPQAPSCRIPAFDPFGEPIEASEIVADSRRVRTAAVVVFWTLAALLTAGRVYTGDQPFASALASAATQIAALTTTVR